LPYPSDYTDIGPYAYYDRWGDGWNVSTECSTANTARSFAGVAWLAAQTSLASQSWRSTDATISVPPNAGPGQPVTVTPYGTVMVSSQVEKANCRPWRPVSASAIRYKEKYGVDKSRQLTQLLTQCILNILLHFVPA